MAYAKLSMTSIETFDTAANIKYIGNRSNRELDFTRADLIINRKEMYRKAIETTIKQYNECSNSPSGHRDQRLTNLE